MHWMWENYVRDILNVGKLCKRCMEWRNLCKRCLKSNKIM